jgi:copper amine oxidase domain protein
MKKKIITLLSILALSSNITSAAPSTVKVMINDKPLVTDTQAIIRNNRTMVPFRAVFESLGAKNISWDEPTQSIVGSDGNITIKLVIGSYDIDVNGKISTMDTPPMIINSRTMIPLSAVSNALGAKVTWDAKKYVASVVKPIQTASNNYNSEIFPISDDVAENINKTIDAGNTTQNNTTQNVSSNSESNFDNISTVSESNTQIQGYYAMEDLKRNKYVLNLKNDGKSEMINISSLNKVNGTYTYLNNKLSMNISSFNSTYEREDVNYAGTNLILMKDTKSPTSGSTFVLLKTTETEYKKYVK